jgi:cold shock CspA family protein
MSNKHVRETGRVVHWNDARGYGFIQTANEHELFLHVSDFVSDDDPHVGDRVSFIERTGRDGKPRAISVMPVTI